jgi:hypothetical protein
MSPEEMLETYFYGIKLTAQDGKVISNEMMRFYMISATEEVENMLDIKLLPQIIDEQHDFWLDEWKAWGYIKVSFPIKKAQKLTGFINDIKQIDYPSEWLSSRKTNDGKMYYRNLYIVPTNGTATTNSVIASGITPHLGFFGNKQIPNYWNTVYCTGFDTVPKDLMNFIGKLASINVFHILGDIILGAGIASQSIGIDGLSQSISTTSSATNAGYGARVQGYLADLKLQLPRLKAFYKGFNMTSL